MALIHLAHGSMGGLYYKTMTSFEALTTYFSCPRLFKNGHLVDYTPSLITYTSKSSYGAWVAITTVILLFALVIVCLGLSEF